MNRYKKLKLSVFVLTLLFIICGTKMQPGQSVRNPFPLHGDTLTCIVVSAQEQSWNHRFSMGYHYQILKEFAKEQGCVLRLETLPDSVSLWTAFMDGDCRVMVLDADCDPVPQALQEQVVVGLPLYNNDAWTFVKDDFEVLQTMYTWFHSFQHTPRYAAIAARFDENEWSGVLPVQNRLSPYDDLIKKYSEVIGWDWRLLAALIYQESNFRKGVTSVRGAIGLMQVIDAVAVKFGMDPERLYEPEENIKAGTLLLKDLTRQLCDSLVEQGELTKFVLAAYNAGPERLKDCRNFALSQGKNPAIWDEVVEVIPLMREKEHYTGTHIRLGYFKGDETIRFVEDVLDRYAKYCALLK